MFFLFVYLITISLRTAEPALAFEPDGSLKYLISAQSSVISNMDEETAFSIKIGNSCILIGIYNLKDKFEEELGTSRIVFSYESFSTAIGNNNFR